MGPWMAFVLMLGCSSSCYVCHGQKSRFLGDKFIPPLMTESLFHGYIFTPTIGLMSLSPIICLVYPPCSNSNSHHQDHYIFSRESQPKPLFATVTGRGVVPNYMENMEMSWELIDPIAHAGGSRDYKASWLDEICQKVLPGLGWSIILRCKQPDLPSLKPTVRPQKMDGWNTSFLL